MPLFKKHSQYKGMVLGLTIHVDNFPGVGLTFEWRWSSIKGMRL